MSKPPFPHPALLLILSASACLAAPTDYWRFEGQEGTVYATAENSTSGGPALSQSEGPRQPNLTNDCPKLPSNTANQTSLECRQENRTALAASGPEVGDFAENTAFTIECWIKPRAYPTAENIYLTVMHKRGIGTSESQEQKPGYQIILGSDQHLTFGAVANDATSKAVKSRSTIPLDSWTHIAVSRDASGKISLYINGAKEDESRGPLPGSLTNDGVLTVGANRFMMAKPPFWEGLIDEVRISATALDPTDLLYTPQ
jgi:hypothetical protein